MPRPVWPWFDELNADRLRSAEAPDRILRQFRPAVHNDRLSSQIGRPVRDREVLPFTVDGRFRWFEAPAATLETFCRYAQIAVSDVWQVLARTGRSCGAPEPLAAVSARAGAAVDVLVETRPDRVVIVKSDDVRCIGFLQPGSGRVSVDGDDSQVLPFRRLDKRHLQRSGGEG